MLISEDFCLKTFTTFGVEVRTRRFIVVSSKTDLEELFEEGYLKERPRMVLGGGSNLLFTGHYPGLILSSQMRGKETVKETADEVWIKVSSGEYWPTFVDDVVEKGYGGVENLCLIPGKVGAAPIQNIGAYGVEVKDVIESLEAFDLDSGEIRTFRNEECNFGYRSSIFKTKEKDKYFILNVTFRLSKKPKLKLSYAPLKQLFKDRKDGGISVKEVSEAIKNIRNSKLPDPDHLKNAGSFFKNPAVSKEKADELKNQYPDMPVYPQPNGKVKLAAGWMIEQCGWKGKKEGNVGVYEKQALILVNYDNASGKEILRFSQKINNSVRKKFGINLKREVIVI
jgi:UDP-N-acetylmuramate dehydrogenase